jgi:hypothetical protein
MLNANISLHKIRDWKKTFLCLPGVHFQTILVNHLIFQGENSDLIFCITYFTLFQVHSFQFLKTVYIRPPEGNHLRHTDMTKSTKQADLI